jgi:hypothetical protein
MDPGDTFLIEGGHVAGGRKMLHVATLDQEGVAGVHELTADRRLEADQVGTVTLARDREHQRVEPLAVATEAEAGRAGRDDARVQPQDVLEVLAVRLEGELGRMAAEEVEVLAAKPLTSRT